MGKSDISALNVQDMRLLVTLQGEGSVSRAADRLGISQSSASYGLDKLRRAFGDPLFVRQGAGVVPTLRGGQLAAWCADMLPRLDALTEPATFDPFTSKRVFRIAATGYEVFAILATAHRNLCRIAPQITLQIEEANTAHAVERLRDRWDILLSPGAPQAGGLRQRKLFHDRYVTFFDGQELAPPDTLAAFVSANHAVVSLDGKIETNVDLALEAQGLTRRIGLVVSSFEHLPAMMQGTKLISTLPERLAESLFAQFSMVRTPLALPDMPLYMVWREAHDPDPAHQWLRNTLFSFRNGRSGD